MIRVGTSGYQFDDWIGSFYPPTLDRRQLLPYYASVFDTVEINASYYRILPPAVYAGMCARVPDNFLFTTKAYQGLTHTKEIDPAQVRLYRQSLQPLLERAQLPSVLLQYPYAFHHTPSNEQRLQQTIAALEGLPLVAEFRHSSWVRDSVFEMLDRHTVSWCAVDEPDLPGLLPPITAPTGKSGYVRLHGRNAQHWWQGGPLRYDWNYTEAELSPWVARVATLNQEKAQTLVFFNNCHLGHAAQNARLFRKLLLQAGLAVSG